jgi:hypothetical protein
MNAKDLLKQNLEFNHMVLKMYLGDLTDADLLVRPAPNANHAAWQLGHLISSEARMVAAVPGGKAPELPPGFADQHTKTTAANDSPQAFLTKDRYVELYDKVRQATLETLSRLSDADLDKPSPSEMARLAPTVGTIFLLAANHEMMHAGGFVPLRRKLGKPVLF